MSIFCKLGMHKRRLHTTYYPSFTAKVITEYKFESICKECGYTKVLDHFKWNSENQEFYEVREG